MLIQILLQDKVVGALGAAKFLGLEEEDIMELGERESGNIHGLYALVDTIAGSDC